MTATDCPHGEPSPACCLDCIAERPAGPDPAATVEARDGRPFPARLPGACGPCGRWIVEGEPIVRTTAGRYVHDACIGGAS